jgi:Na+-translocating ferredoxin:NAD+ oxidoreductase RnfG subunit
LASGSTSRGKALLLAALALLFAAAPARAKVFQSRSQALEAAFPDAERIEDETFVLSDAQVERIQAIAQAPIDSKLVKIYTGIREGRVIGHAVIDVHNVRTMPEAFMVVLTPEGSVRSVRVLAFHEPLEYLPNERWYGQFDEKSLDSPLRVGGDIHAVVGATLSARATTQGVRRALAYYRVLVQEEP